MAKQKQSNSEFKIEKGVPVPSGKSRRGVYPFADMEIGDSFVVQDPRRANIVRQAAWADGSKNGRRFRTRTQSDGSVRIWRIQ